LPLVLVEAAACGCRAVATALPGVVSEIAPALGDALELVPTPRLAGADEPLAADLPAFTERLADAIERGLALPPPADLGRCVEPFTWGAVYCRVEALWRQLLAEPGARGRA
jgi:hypothetical protein